MILNSQGQQLIICFENVNDLVVCALFILLRIIGLFQENVCVIATFINSFSCFTGIFLVINGCCEKARDMENVGAKDGRK